MTTSASSSKAILSVTPGAFEKIGEMIRERNKTETKGVRLGVKSRGCSGLAYTLTFVEDINPQDEKIDLGEFSLFVDSSAVLFLIGSEMIYEETAFQKGFTFKNPNEKGKCGCGESFHV